VNRRTLLVAGATAIAGCGASSDRERTGDPSATAATTRRPTTAPAPPVDVRYAVSLADGAAVRVTVTVERPDGTDLRLVRSDPSGYDVSWVETEGLEQTSEGWRLPAAVGTGRLVAVLARPAATRYDTVAETWALVERSTVRHLLAVDSDAPVSRSVAVPGPGHVGTVALLVGDHERTCLSIDGSTVTAVAPPSADRQRRPGAVRTGVESLLAARRSLGLDAGDVNAFAIPGFEVDVEGERSGLALGDTDFLAAADGAVRFGYFGEGLTDYPLFEPADDFPWRPESIVIYLSLLHDRNERDGYDEREYLRRLARFDPDADVPGVPEMAALDAMLRAETDGRRWFLDVVYGLNALSRLPATTRTTAESRLPFTDTVSREDFERLVAAIAGRERDGWLADRFWPGAVDPTTEPGLASLSLRPLPAALQEIESTWVHEYVHLTQRFSVGPEMQWFVEASANYLTGLHLLYEGQTRFMEFHERYDRDFDGPAPVDRGPLEGYAVDRVLCGLDAEIRRASGDETLLSVVRAMNDTGDTVDRDTFAALVADVAGISLDGWLDHHLTTSPSADIPDDPALFTDRDRFGLGMPRALDAGEFGCGGS
jgi:hypothetical protein